jgi:hypothetical protein
MVRRVRVVALLVWGVMLTLGCGSIRLVSAYDPALDRGTSDVFAKVASFTSRMTRLAGSPEGTYEANAGFYDDVKGEIGALEMRAEAEDKNELTVGMLKELDDNVDRLRKLHERAKDAGLSPFVAEHALQAIRVNCVSITKFELAKRRRDQTRSE